MNNQTEACEEFAFDGFPFALRAHLQEYEKATRAVRQFVERQLLSQGVVNLVIHPRLLRKLKAEVEKLEGSLGAMCREGSRTFCAARRFQNLEKATRGVRQFVSSQLPLHGVSCCTIHIEQVLELEDEVDQLQYALRALDREGSGIAKPPAAVGGGGDP